MKTVFAVIAFLIIGCAQAQQVIPLYGGKIPGNVSDIDNEKSLTPEKGRPSVINVSRPSLIAYLPKTPNAARPAVIICPGGGYVRLTIEDGGYDVARSLVDVYDSMLDSKKQMREELYVQDRLHMKPEGYAIWKKIITPYLIK